MSTTDTIAGYRIIIEALADRMAEEHGEEAAVSLLLAAACTQGINGNLAAAEIQSLTDGCLRRYREAAASRDAGFPALALVAGLRSVN